MNSLLSSPRKSAKRVLPDKRGPIRRSLSIGHGVWAPALPPIKSGVGRDDSTTNGTKPKELTDMTDAQDRLLLQEKIHRTQHKMVDAIERIVDSLTPAPPPPRALAAERRQVANLVGAPKFCARRACRRTHCCQGEPAECLSVVLPLLDADRLAGLLPRRKRRGALRPAPRRGAQARASPCRPAS